MDKLIDKLNIFLKYLKSSETNEVIWVGRPGILFKNYADDNEHQGYHYHPIFIPENLAVNFYAGFCNATLWPLFHYMTAYVVYQEEQWQTYQRVNKLFCEAICNIIQGDDIVWIHDFHLLLLPQLLREKIPEIDIRFFLHMLFPSIEIFQLLPRFCRDKILRSMLGADSIEFFTPECRQFFVKGVRKTLGYKQDMGFITIKNRFVKVDSYYRDRGLLQNKIHHDSEINERLLLMRLKKEIKIILSIDSENNISNIINNLLFYKDFLEKNPKWHRQIILLVIVLPSYQGTFQNIKIKNQVQDTVAIINDKLGDNQWLPILYQQKIFTLDQMIACYSISNIALITLVDENTNVIIIEYLASKIQKKGVLILNQAIKIANQLNGAILINPHCKTELADALKRALEMNEIEQAARIINMQNILFNINMLSY